MGHSQQASMQPSPTKLRVLALHSFRTSASIFKQQFQRAKMVERLGDLVDVVYIDAPHPASGTIPPDVKPFFEGPYYEWLTVEAMGDRLEFDVVKLEKSIEFVLKTMREQGPFDGIVGFSQGTILGSALVAMQHAGKLPGDLPPLKFCVWFAGLKSRYPPHTPLWEKKVAVPSMHVYGDKDGIRTHCKDLADAFKDSIVIQHAYGHRIPVLEPFQLAVFRAFLTSFLPAASGHRHEEEKTVSQQPTSADLSGPSASPAISAASEPSAAAGVAAASEQLGAAGIMRAKI